MARHVQFGAHFLLHLLISDAYIRLLVQGRKHSTGASVVVSCSHATHKKISSEFN